MNDAPKLAKEQLDRLGRSKDRSRRWAWGLLAAAVVLEFLVCAALVDYWWMLSASARGVGFLLLVTLALAGVARGWRIWRRPTSLKESALEVEARRPEAGCVVSTAAEYLSGERQATREYEPELVAALEAQAVKHMRQLRISYARKILQSVALLMFALGTLLLFALLVPLASIALKRIVAPWMPLTYTQVAVTPGSAEIPIGKGLGITNMFTGRPPQNPALHWRDATRPAWQTVALSPGTNTNGVFLHAFSNLQASVKYRVAGGDAVSPEYEITTYIPPEVLAVNLRVKYPGYTRVPPFEPPTPDLTVLRASEINFTITSCTNTAKARLRFSNPPAPELLAGTTNIHQPSTINQTNALPDLELTPGPNHQWSGQLQATQDTDYWIVLADAKGHLGGTETPYHLKVLPDKPPKVDILEPGEDLRAEATNTIPLLISASDDFGVQQIRLVYHKLGEPEQTVVCAQTNHKNGEVTARAALDLAGMNLREYELVAYHAEAIDNNTLDGPGMGASPVYFIEITNDDEGDKSKPKSKGNGQQVNLLVVQKQIIADTTALAPTAPAEPFNELSSRQKEAAEFADLYLKALSERGGSGEATKLMEQAAEQMRTAGDALARRSRSEALPPEEKALANLYQVIKLKPELENLPTEPPPPSETKTNAPQNEMVNVVLEAIKKQKKEPSSDEEIAQALEEAKRLSQSQAGMNQAYERSDQSKGQSEPKESKLEENQSQPADSQQGQSQGKPRQKANSKAGQQASKPQESQSQEADAQQGQGQGKQRPQANSKAGQQESKSEENESQQADSQQGQGQGGQRQQANSKAGKQPQAPQQKQQQQQSDEQTQQAQAGSKGGVKPGEPSDPGEPMGGGEEKKEKEMSAKAKGGSKSEERSAETPSGKGGESNEESEPQDEPPSSGLPQMAEMQEHLSREAAALAEKLEKLAGKDIRLGHNAGQRAGQAAGQMAAAARALRQGNRVAAGSAGAQGRLQLDKAAALLERLLKDQPNLTDVAAEDFPKEYEALISEYLKKLSYEK